MIEAVGGELLIEEIHSWDDIGNAGVCTREEECRIKEDLHEGKDEGSYMRERTEGRQSEPVLKRQISATHAPSKRRAAAQSTATLHVNMFRQELNHGIVICCVISRYSHELAAL